MIGIYFFSTCDLLASFLMSKSKTCIHSLTKKVYSSVVSILEFYFIRQIASGILPSDARRLFLPCAM